MSAIFSTPRIFGLVLIGLMITSCRGYTSSYIQPSTPTVNRQQSTSNDAYRNLLRQNAADTYADCARIGDPSLNCDLDLRGVP
ncbi:hypothetical protein NWP22_14985 [Anabaenopsis tanganyikae CS-531]|uniref:Uncharacterized protein n=1 Tax=Anabaenopsis tanganyikae CS-531 TaxID=2785304 RepID=A0ABT6KHZ5_9CYAN|nr:hypothetical protein [Anabaenopsis tanganyikae]MDH6107150.1 hypothetical protein [Anabaenopsis tanganyikae CS-531]